MALSSALLYFGRGGGGGGGGGQEPTDTKLCKEFEQIDYRYTSFYVRAYKYLFGFNLLASDNDVDRIINLESQKTHAMIHTPRRPRCRFSLRF